VQVLLGALLQDVLAFMGALRLPMSQLVNSLTESAEMADSTVSRVQRNADIQRMSSLFTSLSTTSGQVAQALSHIHSTPSVVQMMNPLFGNHQQQQQQQQRPAGTIVFGQPLAPSSTSSFPGMPVPVPLNSNMPHPVFGAPSPYHTAPGPVAPGHAAPPTAAPVSAPATATPSTSASNAAP